MPKISLVIPAFNEELLLPRLLDTVNAARENYRGGADAVEVIVADNQSTDATARIAGEKGARVVSVAPRRIACVRNAGAQAATGEILCFVDADMRVHPDTFNAIDEALSRGDVIAGASGVRLERWSLGIAMTYAVIVPLVIVMKMDTGVVFCRKADFEAVGGYDERRELAEDVAFLFAMRARGKQQGKKLTRLRYAKAIVSMRKFDEHGDWHYFTKLIPMAIPALLNPSLQTELAKRYWYVDKR